MHAFMGVVRIGARPAELSDRHALTDAASAWLQPTTIVESPHAVFVSTRESPTSGDEPGPRAADCSRARPSSTTPQTFLRSLGLRPPTGHAALVREVFEARGGDGLAAVRGAFSFALWREDRRELTLARDCGRGMNLYFHRTDDLVIFASHLPSLISHRDVPRELDEQVVASFLSHDRYQHRRTFFRSIDRVPPRYTVTINPSLYFRGHAYWATRRSGTTRSIKATKTT